MRSSRANYEATITKSLVSSSSSIDFRRARPSSSNSWDSISYSSAEDSSSQLTHDDEESLSSSSSSTHDALECLMINGGGVPFSWEQIPGIPKVKLRDNNLLYARRLPPPPALAKKHHHPCISAAADSTRKSMKNGEKRDPFFAALLACSRDEAERDDHAVNFIIWKLRSNISKTFSRMKINVSCKRAEISESILLLSSKTKLS